MSRFADSSQTDKRCDKFNEVLHAGRESKSHLSWSPVYLVYQKSSYQKSYTSVYLVFFGCPRFHPAISMRAESTWSLPSIIPLRLLVTLLLLEIVVGGGMCRVRDMPSWCWRIVFLSFPIHRAFSQQQAMYYCFFTSLLCVVEVSSSFTNSFKSSSHLLGISSTERDRETKK